MQHFFRKRPPLKRVLSIQSYVVSGYVGNKSATFPLQVLGFDVDAINSVQRSNHTGYKHFDGQVLNSEDLKALFNSLVKNGTDRYSHFLTGYCPDVSFLKETANVYKQLKSRNRNLAYVCDPAFGDNGNFYEAVNEQCYPIYRDLILQADIITPNQFEAEVLSGVSITSEAMAFKAMKELHLQGPNVVVLTSANIPEEGFVIMASTKDSMHQYIRLELEKFDAMFYGTGDLFASMLLAWLHEHPQDLKLSCEKAVSAMQVVLQRTLSSAEKLYGRRKLFTPAQLELKLVQSLDEIRNPPLLYDASVVNVDTSRRRRMYSGTRWL